MVGCLFFITFTRSYSLVHSAFFRSSSRNSAENIETDIITSRACWTSSFFGGTTGSPSTGYSSSPLFYITFSSDLKVASISSAVEGIACDTNTSASTSINVCAFNLFGTRSGSSNRETIQGHNLEPERGRLNHAPQRPVIRYISQPYERNSLQSVLLPQAKF